MSNLPTYIGILIALSTLATFFLFYKASSNSKAVLFILFLWLVLQGFISLSGFYTHTETMPPRLFLAVLPPLLFILGMFLTAQGKLFINNLDLRYLTIIHLVRIPVELVLLLLFLHQKVPMLMTFEGSNFDIISGISAPLIYYFAFSKQQINKRLLLIWNFICLGLLLNIVALAVLSAPFPFQQFAFDQPNIGILYFPFTYLPCCIVPLVLLSHLASIRQLIKE